MKDYVKKIMQEKDELRSRILRAKKAIENKPYGFDETSEMLLKEQVDAMTQYFRCLEKRFDYEKNK